MDVPILVCGCGMRVRAPGAKPGRVGRCPACGGRLEVPDLSGIPDDFGRPIAIADEAESGFGPIREIVLTPSRTAAAEPERRGRRRGPTEVGKTPMADGILPVQAEPESAWRISFVYPMRGAESLAVVAAIGVILWIFAVLVPEYCLQAMADTAKMGASILGTLFVWIAVIPVVFLGPLALSYWLQYLGRVLVSSAMGECAPPRMPDRNFEGFFSGLSPWFVWLVLGLGIGLAPALWFAFPGGRLEGGIPWLSMSMGVVALPYILAALMLSFLHDDAMAATPWGVVLGLVRLGPSFLMLSGLIAVALALAGGGLAVLIWVRAHWFWPYLLLALVWWIAFLWIEVVVMRLLGVFYFQRREALGWNRAHPRWGVAWRL